MKKIYHHLNSIDSTNAYAMQNLKTYERDALTIVFADEQTAGRGQYGRSWDSPKDCNLYASFCFFLPEQENEKLPFSITLLLARSTIAVLGRYRVNLEVKKPNDLVINGKKIGGILCETTSLTHTLGVVIGLGLNINMPDRLLKNIDQPATSLFAETNTQWEIKPILEQITEQFAENLKTLME